MALPKEPDRLKPHCSWPPPPGERDPDDIWLDYGGMPPDCDPPTCDPLRNLAQTPKRLSVWAVGIRILLLLTALIAGICLWQL